MKEYAIGVVAASFASGVILMITKGVRHERLVSSVCALSVALAVLAPLRSLVDEGKAAASYVASEAAEKRDVIAARGVVRAQEVLILESVKEKYPGAGVKRVSIEADITDPGNIEVISVTLEASGDADEACGYVASVTGCDNVIYESG